MRAAEHTAPPRRWVDPAEALGRRPPTSGGAEPEPLAPELTARYGFLVGALGLLVPEGTIGEIIEDAAIFPVPNTADWLLGMINQRGALVPVFDLGAMLDAPLAAVGRVMVVGDGPEAAAFPVATLPRPIPVGEAVDPRPPVPAPFEAHARAAYLVDEQLWLEVDLDALLIDIAADISR